MFSDDCVLQLWRIFCHLAELVEDEESRLEVALAASEVEIIAKQFMAALGKSDDWDPEEFDLVVSVIPAFKFSIFLAVIESKYAIDNDSDTLEEAVKDLHDYFLHDVINCPLRAVTWLPCFILDHLTQRWISKGGKDKRFVPRS